MAQSRSKKTPKQKKVLATSMKVVEKPAEPTKEKKRRPLNIRERRFIKALMQPGMTPTAAMREAGYKNNTANTKQGEKLEKVREPIAELMDRMGLTDERLMEVMRDGVRATTVKIAADKGIITDEHVYDDHATRHRYLETGLKLKGHLRDKIELSNPDGTGLFSDLERANRLQHLIELAKKRAGEGKKK